MRRISISIIVVIAATLLVFAGAFGAGTEKEPMKGAQAGAIILSKDLIGKEVLDQKNEKIGKVENLVIDHGTGRVSLALVQTRGFIEIGEKFVAIPFQALSPKDDKLAVNMSKDQIAKAPTFTEREFKSIDRTSEGEIYRYFGVSPYWEEKPMMEREEPMMREPGTMQPGMPPGGRY